MATMASCRKAEQWQQWQATLYSAARGIERKEKAHGYSGAEPSKACLMFEMQSRKWSHEIGMQSLRMRRILDMNPETLPGKVYTELMGSSASRRRKYKTTLHRSGRSIQGIPMDDQYKFQFCTLKEKKKRSNSMWERLN